MEREQIKEINQHISDALAQWQAITNIADADNWAFYLNYNEVDLFNALYIFNHVAQNKAIKDGFYTSEDEAETKMRAFRNSIKICFGFDTVELTDKVLSSKRQSKN